MYKLAILTVTLVLVATPGHSAAQAAQDAGEHGHNSGGPSSHVPRIVAHFASRGIVLTSEERNTGRHKWIATHPEDACFVIVVSFAEFQTRGQMAYKMPTYASGSIQHPEVNVAMFSPFLRGTDSDACRNARSPGLGTLHDKYVRVFMSYENGTGSEGTRASSTDR